MLKEELYKSGNGYLRLLSCFSTSHLSCSKEYFSFLNAPFMFKKFTLADKLLMLAAILSLVYSEVLFFQGNPLQAIFIGLWVPSILCFGIYLKFINRNNHD